MRTRGKIVMNVGVFNLPGCIAKENAGVFAKHSLVRSWSDGMVKGSEGVALWKGVRRGKSHILQKDNVRFT